jgi:hypothetical protein
MKPEPTVRSAAGQDVSQDDRCRMLDVLRRGHEDEATRFRLLAQVCHPEPRRLARQLLSVATSELLEAGWNMSVPFPQLGARSDVLEPLFEGCGIFRDPAGPEAVDEHVARTRLGVVVGAGDPYPAHFIGSPAGKAVRPLDRRQACPRRRHVQGETVELFEVKRGEGLESSCTFLGELQPDDAVVLVASGAANQACRFGPVDQPHRTVMAEEKVVGDLTDGWAAWVGMPTDRQEQLVVCRSEASGACLLGAPGLEVSEAGSQGEKPGVGRVRQGHS